MSNQRSKKIKRRKQQDGLKRSRSNAGSRSSRRRLIQGGDSDGAGQSSRRLRSKSAPTLGHVEARRARANAVVSRDSSALLRVAKPPKLRRQNASRDVSKAKLTKEPKPKIDLGKGRMIYPVTKGGVTEYLPARRDASESEIEAGAFVEDEAVRNDPVNTITDASNFERPTVTDVKTKRTLFATTTTNSKGEEKTEYLPRQSEATPLELSAGKYIPEKASISGEVVDQPSKPDPNNPDRNLPRMGSS